MKKMHFLLHYHKYHKYSLPSLRKLPGAPWSLPAWCISPPCSLPMPGHICSYYSHIHTSPSPTYSPSVSWKNIVEYSKNTDGSLWIMSNRWKTWFQVSTFGYINFCKDYRKTQSPVWNPLWYPLIPCYYWHHCWSVSWVSRLWDRD